MALGSGTHAKSRAVAAVLLIGGVLGFGGAAGGSQSYTLSPPIIDAASALFGVSCPTSAWCITVGHYRTGSTIEPLVERWNGTNWSRMTTPKLASGGTLFDVKCRTTTNCVAVGGTGSATLVEHFDGFTWSIVSSPSPVGIAGTALRSVSCPSATRCFAVGNVRHLFTSQPSTSYDSTLIERWDGNAWSIVTRPSPGEDDSLKGVSCPSTQSCFAVGHYLSAGILRTLIEHWNGASWSTTNTGIGVLDGVSCPNVTTCLAVGNVGGFSSRAWAVRWNGSRWSIMGPGYARADEVHGVRCIGRNCVAVGTIYGGESFVSHWDGAHWVRAASANRAGVTYNLLLGVSCVSTVRCVAVGYSDAPVRALVEQR